MDLNCGVILQLRFEMLFWISFAPLNLMSQLDFSNRANTHKYIMLSFNIIM